MYSGLCDGWSMLSVVFIFFFFFNDTATTEIYTLSLHDALPISCEYRPENQGCEIDCSLRTCSLACLQTVNA